MRLRDSHAVILILIFVLGVFTIRLGISQSLLYDESEQYLLSNAFHLGYPNQPPLYNWAVYALSRIIGMGLPAIAAVKYLSLFLFYLGVYFSARRLWPVAVALSLTASVLILPQYSFKIVEDLTHTVLMVAIASFTMLAFLRIAEERRTGDYMLLGLLFGLGMLAKYNYVFLASSLIIAALITIKHRDIVLDWKFLISIFTGILIFSPHAVWLASHGFQAITHTASRGEFGGLNIQGLLKSIGSSYWPAAMYAVVFIMFFGIPSLEDDEREMGSLLRRTCILALVIPVMAILASQAGFFKAKWLAPSLFTIPLALYTMVEAGSKRIRFIIFNTLVVLLAIAVLAVRIVGGFFPDLVSGGGRELIPYHALSSGLEDRLNTMGLEPSKTVLVADSPMIAANIIKDSSFEDYAVIDYGYGISDEKLRLIKESGAVLVWDARDGMTPMPEEYHTLFPKAAVAIPVYDYYTRSKKKRFTLGIAYMDVAMFRSDDSE